MSGLNVEYLCRAYENLCKDFFCPTNKSKYEDYIGLEKLSEEFLRLDLPKASDVLNAAAGPGILSAWLQSHGYFRLDAHDSDLATIKHLRSSGLYNNLICRSLNGLNSSGLKEDIYDAVVMLGGFSPGNIPPAALSEIMRITKPDGHILWTLREDYHSHYTEYGLLDENLAALEREGKCLILKMGERFVDSHSGINGLLYVIRRVEDAEDFEPAAGGVVPEIVVDTVKAPTTAIVADAASAVLGESATGRYELVNEPGGPGEDNVVEIGHYTGSVKLCQAFFKLQLQRTVEILDVSSHLSNPGLVGKELVHNGYIFVDGLDHNLAALNATKEMGIYRNYILAHVAKRGSIPVRDESYDVILMASGFAPGKILPSSFTELIRVLRPGGYIMFTMRDGYGASDPDFALFDVRVQDLVLERKWELLVGPVFFDGYFEEHAGRFYMLRKCHREVFALGSPRHSPHSSPKMQRRKLSAA